jgi:putative membrane protein
MWTTIDKHQALVRNISIFTVWLFILSALIGISLGHVDWFITKTPLNLLLGLLLLIINVRLDDIRAWAAFAIAFAVGMGIEILGVSTGKIFGIYSYGANLGPKAYEVPFMIGTYWAVLTIASSMVARHYSQRRWMVSAIGASIMVMLDYLMEQVSCRLDFWCFANDHAPLQNYIAWWITAFLLHFVTHALVADKGKLYCTHLLLSQGAFFVGVYFLV